MSNSHVTDFLETISNFVPTPKVENKNSNPVLVSITFERFTELSMHENTIYILEAENKKLQQEVANLKLQLKNKLVSHAAIGRRYSI
jgi:uncharacterized protein YkvS